MKKSYKKIILLTGKTGFVGGHIYKTLKSKYNFYMLDRTKLNKLIKTSNFKDVPKNIDAIIHTAAEVSVEKSFIDPFKFFNFNLNSTLALANLCINKKIKKFIFLNTYGYGNNVKNPIAEDSFVNPHSPYSKSKYLSEKLLFDFLPSEVDKVSLRLFNLYGFNQSNSFLIPSMIHQAMNSNVIEVAHSRSKRDYLYIIDLINLIDKVIPKKGSSGIYNVGTGTSHSPKDIKNYLEKILNKNLKLKTLNINRNNDIENCYANNTKVINEFDWKINYNLYDGLTDMLNRINT